MGSVVRGICCCRKWKMKLNRTIVKMLIIRFMSNHHSETHCTNVGLHNSVHVISGTARRRTLIEVDKSYTYCKQNCSADTERTQFHNPIGDSSARCRADGAWRSMLRELMLRIGTVFANERVLRRAGSHDEPWSPPEAITYSLIAFRLPQGKPARKH